MHVEPIDVKVVVIESTDLKHEAGINNDKSGVKFSDRHVRQLPPVLVLRVDVKHVAVKVSHGHATHAHIGR